MSLGQRVRRSRRLFPARLTSPVLFAALLGAALGLPRSLILPYLRATSPVHRPRGSAAHATTPGTPAGGRLRPGASLASAAASPDDGRSHAFSLSRRDFNMTQGTPSGAKGPQDDIHPSWTPDGQSFVWSSTFFNFPDPMNPTLPYTKLLPMLPDTTGTTTTTAGGLVAPGSVPLQATTGGATSPGLTDVPQYSIYIRDITPRLRGTGTTGGTTTGGTTTGGTQSPYLPTVRILTKATGNQIYPAMNPNENFLLYVATPLAMPKPMMMATTAGTSSSGGVTAGSVVGPGATPLQAGGVTTGGTTAGNTATPADFLAPDPLPWTLEMIDVSKLNPDDPNTAAPVLQITTPCMNVQKPVWSPDGSTFIFSCEESSGKWDLYYGTLTAAILQSDWDDRMGNQPQPNISLLQFSGQPGGILNDPNAPDLIDPAISPDGQWVAFTRTKVTLHGGMSDPVDIKTSPLRATLTRDPKNTHVWVAPIRNFAQPVDTSARPVPSNPNSVPNGPIQIVLGQPRQITRFSILRAGNSTPVSSSEYLPAWTSGMGLAFATNREDRNGDRIPDEVGTTTSIYSVFNGTEAEATAAPVILNRPGALVVDYPRGNNLARKETFNVPAPDSNNEEYASYNPTAAAPVEFNEDLLYQMDLDLTQVGGAPAKKPLDPTNVLRDVWETIAGSGGGPLSDNVFDLQGTPTVTPRLQVPGKPVRIEAAVVSKSDQTFPIRVADVTALIRDPDQPLFGGAPQGATQSSPSSSPLSVGTQPGQRLVSPVDGSIQLPTQLESGALVVDTVQLFDDGPAGGHGDRIAGDGIFTNIWTTPTVARDYYLDVAVRGDRALQNGSPFGGGFAFDYFDNAWGFSTRQFQRRTNLLLVSDYTAGQQFIHARTQVDPLFGREYTVYPVESYFTSRPYPTQEAVVTTGTAPRPVFTWPTPAQRAAGQAFGTAWAVLGLDSPYGDDFDIWRTQCRDAFPDPNVPGADATYYQGQSLQDAINAYLPHQVAGFTNTGSPRQITVADRGIVWASPYTGDITAADINTIRSPSVQQLLITYLNKGGRLMATGEDLAWALTLNGAQTNQLLNSYFHVQFEDDASSDIIEGFTPFRGNRHKLTPISIAGTTTGGTTTGGTTTGGTGTAAVGSDPLTISPWIGHWVFLPDNSQMQPFATPPVEITGPFGLFNPNPFGQETKWDGAWNQVLIDGIAPTAGTPLTGGANSGFNLVGGSNLVQPGVPTPQITFEAPDPFPAGNTNPRDGAVIYRDPVRGYRTVFLSFGLEGVHRHYEEKTIGNNMIIFSSNRPAEIMHNAICWLRQGGVSGRVTDIYLGRPIPGALVVAHLPLVVNGVEQPGPIAGAAVTDDNGNYTIQGLDADVYRLTVSKPGFLFQHLVIEGVHGGQTTENANLSMDRVSPGNIAGSVTDATGQPAAGVTVQARMVTEAFGSPPAAVTNGPLYTGATDNTGNFFLPGAEVGGYDVSVLVADKVMALKGDVRVSSNATTTVTLQITGTPSTVHVSGRVLDSNGAPVAGIQVTATGASGQAGQVQTDASGNYAFDLPPGTYVLRAVNGAGAQASESVVLGTAAVTQDLVLGQSPTGPVTQIVIPAGLSMISLPNEFNGNAFATLIGGQTFTVAAWTGTAYAITPDPQAATVQVGHGYFIRVAAPVTLTIPSTGAATGVQPINLQAGWNLIGNPFTSAVPLSAISVTQSGSVMSLPQAAGNGLLDSVVWTLDSAGNYQKATTLDPGKGYWIFSRAALTLSLQAPAASSALATLRRSPGPLPFNGISLGPAGFGLLPGAASAATHPEDWSQRIRSLSEWVSGLVRGRGSQGR